MTSKRKKILWVIGGVFFLINGNLPEVPEAVTDEHLITIAEVPTSSELILSKQVSNPKQVLGVTAIFLIGVLLVCYLIFVKLCRRYDGTNSLHFIEKFYYDK